MGVAVPAKIRQRGRLGKVGRITRDSPATGFWAWLGERGCRRVWTAAPGDGGRWSPCFGEVAARWDTWARRWAIAGVGEGGGHFSWGMQPVGPWVHRGGPYWRRRTALWAAGEQACARCMARLNFKGEQWERACTVKGHQALTRGTASGLDRRARRGNPRRTGGHRRARMAAWARTPHGMGADFKGLGVLPASGRSDLGTARAA
jgi:hypothetical protein